VAGVASDSEALLAERIEREFVDGLIGGREQFDRYCREVEASGLLEHLQAGYEEFWGMIERSSGYNTGRLGDEEGMRLYALMRELQPETVVETGVCNGFSTAFLLLGLDRNGAGELHSLDLPDVVGEVYDPGTFWEGKRGAAIPPGKDPGWVIPDELRGRWRLVLGRSQEELPGLLERRGTLDFFMHDSEHSYECMRFEFEMAWPALRDGGVLVADDWDWNDAFMELAQETHRTPVTLGTKLMLLRK
jgi:predicted O-methyltransferase YrrM